jgi:hypothetical protein
MANRLWWAACVLVGVIVLVELAAVALWLINHYPASQATTTTIQEAKLPEPLASGKFESDPQLELDPISSELAQLASEEGGRFVTCNGYSLYKEGQCYPPGDFVQTDPLDWIELCRAPSREAVEIRVGCRGQITLGKPFGGN